MKTLGDEMRDELQHQQWLIENGKLYDAMKQRAEAAEARAAELQFELDCITRERDAAIAEVKRANAGFAAMKREYDKAMTRLAAHGEKVTA